jgi:phosphoserine phosphatase RsbU/P
MKGLTLSTHRRPTVLVVDDNPVNLEVLEAIFIQEGFGVIKAEGGVEAKDRACAELPDLILLDIMMPGEDGFETCSKLKSDPATTDIPVIFISAVDDVHEKVKGLKLGAVDYITKPFEPAEVLARTRVHIRLREAHMALVEEQTSRLKQLKEAQEAILTRPDDHPGSGFAVHYKPVCEAGGDFYDVVEVGEGIFGYFIADVSGHSVGNSLPTSALKALLHRGASPLYTCDQMMRMLNQSMSSILPQGQFLTACYVHLNRLKARLMVISAGHLPAIYVHLRGQTEVIRASGDVIGVFKSISFDIHEQSVSKGDRLFIYTDGLIERFAGKKRSWREGIKILRNACGETRHRPMETAITDIVNIMCPNGSSPADDLVLLGVEI